MNANNHIDHNIDRALAGLRDAQPRSGLNGRILASLEHRTVAPPAIGFHISVHFALWAAASAAILAVTSLAILHRSAPTKNAVILSEASHSDANKSAVILSDAERATRVEGESKNPDAARRATNPEPFFAANLARTPQTVSSRPEHRSLAAMHSGETCISNHDDLGCPVATTPTDAQALADWHAPSHPAPPLPLTPQEKLFIRMLQYGNATELAELNPLTRAKEDADETTAFKAFFPEPPPLKQPLGDTE